MASRFECRRGYAFSRLCLDEKRDKAMEKLFCCTLYFSSYGPTSRKLLGECDLNFLMDERAV